MAPVLFGENDNNLKVTHFALGDPKFTSFAEYKKTHTILCWIFEPTYQFLS